jgi:hypothetical protein
MVYGGFGVMKSKFDNMSHAELRAYVLEHREDIEALREFMSRRSPDDQATWYKFPDTEEGNRQMKQVFRERIAKTEK